MRKPIIIGNWKMNKTINETLAFLNQVDKECSNLQIEVGLGVPFLSLQEANKNANSIIITAQNCHYEDNGAFTGEISIEMLKEIFITHVIIGHSERRQMFNETDQTINLKVKKLLANNMIPIICCGETLFQYVNNQTNKIVESQIEKALKNVTAQQAEKVIITYEPIWAIGTGKTATAEIAENVCKIIRTKISKIYDDTIAERIRIQYGGSVKADNIQELLNQPNIDGALVGGASLTPASFLSLVK